MFELTYRMAAFNLTLSQTVNLKQQNSRTLVIHPVPENEKFHMRMQAMDKKHVWQYVLTSLQN